MAAVGLYPGHITGTTHAQADSFARRLRRRSAITARPPGVAIRARKPILRLRFSLEGWYVRFIARCFHLD